TVGPEPSLAPEGTSGEGVHRCHHRIGLPDDISAPAQHGLPQDPSVDEFADRITPTTVRDSEGPGNVGRMDNGLSEEMIGKPPCGRVGAPLDGAHPAFSYSGHLLGQLAPVRSCLT